MTCPELHHEGWAESTALTNRCSFPIEPRNTFSNLAYVVAGVALALTQHSLAGTAFGILMGFLGIGSGLYHGLVVKWADKLDNAGMYAVFAGLVVYALAPTSPIVGVVELLAAIAAVAVLNYTLTVDLDILMGLLLTVPLLHGWLVGSIPLTTVSLALFGASYYVWHLDQRPVPPTGLWGHAFWHFGTATAIVLMFLGQVR